MSYILDALRKAEAERERGGAPDGQAPALPPLALAPAARPPGGVPLRWLLLVAVLAAMAAGVAWWLWGRGVWPRAAPAHAAVAAAASAEAQAAARVASQPAAASAALAALAAVPAASAPDTMHGVSAVAAAAASDATQTLAPRAQSAAAKPRPERKAVSAGKDRSEAATAKRDKAAAPVARTEAATAPVAPLAARLPKIAELPAELRQQLPPLAVGGSVYSPQPRARIVIVNGQVFQEGSQLTPELRLEQIRPKAAVLSIRGTRFELPL